MRGISFLNPKATKLAFLLLMAGLGFARVTLPAVAEGTQAGTNISNTATATYVDPNDPNTPINSTSNPVVVVVAEVAGITVTASGTTFKADANTDNKINSGDTLYYTYRVTNVGNDTTQFRIPNLAAITGPATLNGSLEYSNDGGNTWITINTTAAPATEVTTPAKAPGEFVLVRVPVTIAPGAQSGNVITVTLGNTPGNAQNQPRSADGGDVHTVDAPNGTSGEVDGAPVNGVREASDGQQVTVEDAIKAYSLATLLKVRSGYSDGGTPADIVGDTLTYDLSLRVENTDPTGNGLTPAPLLGTTVPGLTGTNVLVADAIPTGTELAVAPTPPTNWTVVYSVNDPTTIDANAATWTTTAPALNTVRRVGFVYNTAVRGAIATGTTVSGFQVTLRVATGATSPLTVANIAQMFGSSPNASNQPGAPVYDESGDDNPSNYSDDGTPLLGTDTNGDRIPDTLPDTSVDDGFANTPSAPEQGTDSGNNNTGSDSPASSGGGEANVFTIQVAQPSSLLNGPNGTPNAIGPDGTNATDFTNKSSLVPAGTLPNTLLNPQPVGFTNSLLNNGQSTGTVTLIPLPPLDPSHLPNGTTVTLTYGSSSATYTYNSATGFSLTAGSAISIPGVAANQSLNYGVEVDLPDSTPLSTEINRGFPVRIQAGIDTGGDATPEATNITIDRVYTGFLKLLKESRILTGNGPAPAAADTTFSVTQKSPLPGNWIEYRVTYSNISEPQSGTGNVILNAAQITITEDGVSGTNNWARDNDTNGVIDTSNVVGSAQDSGPSTITFFSGNPAIAPTSDQSGFTVNTDVTKYVNQVPGPVAPQQSRTFIFQRRVN